MDFSHVLNGIDFRLFQLHGIDRLPLFFDYLRPFKASNAAPLTWQAREDIHVQGLAAAARSNLGCYVDFWRWYTSTPARSAMTAKYGATNILCSDKDGDGYSPLAGDCDDTDPNVHPGATDSNGRDNDCDGFAGDTLSRPAGGFDGRRSVSIPSRIVGRLDVHTADGPAGTARLYYPVGLAVDAGGDVFEADCGHNRIRKIDPAGGLTAFSGSGVAGEQDGPALTTTFDFGGLGGAAGLARDSAGNLYVAEVASSLIRKVSPDGSVATLAGHVPGSEPGDTGGGSGIPRAQDGTGSAASFQAPFGLAVDAGGDIFVADSANHLIRKISPSAQVTTVAGSGGQSGATDGTASAARFNNPLGVAVDATGNVFVADADNHTIRRISQSGVVTTIAGRPGSPGSADGAGDAARFSHPYSVAVGSAGDVYVADYDNHTIRKISAAGVVTTFAGAPGQTGHVDGRGSAARFYRPIYLTIDAAGSLFVAEKEVEVVRKITPDGMVSTLAGTVNDPGSADSDNFSLRLALPTNVSFTLKSAPDFQGWLFLDNQTGGGWYGYNYVGRGGSALSNWNLAPGVWNFNVGFNSYSLPGGYELTVAETERWPDYWAATAPPAIVGQAFRLSARLLTSKNFLRTPTSARFWVSGIGWVGAVPYQSVVAIDWTPPAGTGLGVYGYRVQLFDGATPVSEATPPEWFTVAAPLTKVPPRVNPRVPRAIRPR